MISTILIPIDYLSKVKAKVIHIQRRYLPTLFYFIFMRSLRPSLASNADCAFANMWRQRDGRYFLLDANANGSGRVGSGSRNQIRPGYAHCIGSGVGSASGRQLFCYLLYRVIKLLVFFLLFFIVFFCALQFHYLVVNCIFFTFNKINIKNPRHL